MGDDEGSDSVSSTDDADDSVDDSVDVPVPEPSDGSTDPSASESSTSTGDLPSSEAASSSGPPQWLTDYMESENDGWAITSLEPHPYTNAHEVVPNPNAFTGGDNVCPFTAAQNAPTYAHAPSGILSDRRLIASIGPIPDTDFSYSPLRISSVPFKDIPPIDLVPSISGDTYAHYQITLNGVAYDAYVNDRARPGQALLVERAGPTPPVATSPATTQIAQPAPTGPATSASAVPIGSALPTTLSQAVPSASLHEFGAGPNSHPEGAAAISTAVPTPMYWERTATKQTAEQRMRLFGTWDLPPAQLEYPDLEYTLVYGLKQTIYSPIKSWLLGERRQYLDSSGRIQTSSIRPDRSAELSIAFGTVASIFLPAPKIVVADELLAFGARLDSSLSELGPTFGNLGGPQAGKLLGVLERTDGFYRLEGSATPLTGKVDFVIQDGKILVGEGHGFLAGGGRVTYAGELHFAKDGSGALESFSNVSGHIRPAGAFAGNALPFLPDVPFKPPSYFPISAGLPQLPVFQPFLF